MGEESIFKLKWQIPEKCVQNIDLAILRKSDLFGMVSENVTRTQRFSDLQTAGIIQSHELNHLGDNDWQTSTNFLTLFCTKKALNLLE